MGAGRPLEYATAEELQDAIQQYIDSLDGKPTITGLAYFLGFESRQSFYDYEQRPEFSYTIKRARLYIENQYESRLHEPNPTGAIFALKNFGWIDTQKIDHSGELAILQPAKFVIDESSQDAPEADRSPAGTYRSKV